MRIDDPSFPRRLVRLLQSRGTNVQTPQDVPFAGLVITIPGEALFERATRIAPLAGTIRELTLDPAAGADVIFTPGLGSAWKIQSIKGTLVTAAAGPTRLPRFFIGSAAALTDILLGADPSSGQAGGETVNWTWARGLSRTGRTADLVGTNEMPDVWVVGNGTRQVGIATGNIQAGDNWGLVRMWIEEFVYTEPAA